MNINQPVPKALLRKRQEELVIVTHPQFLYLSRPGDGQSRYVFQRKVCLSRREALEYIYQLEKEALNESTEVDALGITAGTDSLQPQRAL